MIKITVSGDAAVGKSTIIKIIEKALRGLSLNVEVKMLDENFDDTPYAMSRRIGKMQEHNLPIKIIEKRSLHLINNVERIREKPMFINVYYHGDGGQCCIESVQSFINDETGAEIANKFVWRKVNEPGHNCRNSVRVEYSDENLQGNWDGQNYTR